MLIFSAAVGGPLPVQLGVSKAARKLQFPTSELRLLRRLLFWLGLSPLPFLLLFLLQPLLLFGVFLQQLLSLLLMLLLELLFFGGIGLLLCCLCVFLLLLLLDCLAFLQLLRVELILFLLVLSVQLGVRGRWDSGSRWRRTCLGSRGRVTGRRVPGAR